MSQLELPQEFATYVESKTKSNGSGGRPTFVQRIAKEGRALDEILTITEKAWIQSHSCRSIADYYSRRGYKVDTTTIFRMLKDLEPFKDLLIKYLETTPRRKQFYNPVTDSSDYETVSQYIRRARRSGLKTYKQYIKNAKRCWKFLGYTDPKNWSAEGVLGFFETLSDAAKSNMLDSVRVIAPQIQDKHSPNYVASGRFRRKINVRKKPVFAKEMKLIMKALEKRGLLFELLIFCLHVTLGAREGQSNPKSGMVGLHWKRFHDGFTKVDLFESKGELWSRNCPTDTLFPHLPEQLRELWKERGQPKTDKLLLGGYKELTAIYQRIRETLSEYYEDTLEPDIFEELTTMRPHDADKIHVNLLWEAGVPMEIVAGQYKGRGEGEGLVGRIWKSLDIMKKHYLSLTRKSARYQKIRRKITKYSHQFNGGS